MKFKGLLAVGLAGVMMLGAVPAFADDATAVGEQKFEAAATVQTPTIKVTLGAVNGKVTANPYNISVADTKMGTVTDSLIGDVISVINKSNVGVQIGVTGAITLGSNSTVSILSSEDALATAQAEQKKNGVLVEAKTYSTFTEATETGKTGTFSGQAENCTVVYSAAGKKMATVPVLAAGTGVAAAANGGGCYLVFLLREKFSKRMEQSIRG